MKNKAHDAATYVFRADESILIDANIWLYLQPPPAQPTPPWGVAYSNVFSRLLQASAQPLIDAMIASEYLNRYIRLEYNAIWIPKYPKFKDFRQSNDAEVVLESAVAELQQIFNTSQICDTSLVRINWVSVFADVKNGIVDFNDGLMIENCRLHGWKLLTNDGDMTNGGVDLLTTNRALLRSCP